MYRARSYLTKKQFEEVIFFLHISVSDILPWDMRHFSTEPSISIFTFTFVLQKKIIRIMTFSSYYAHTDTIFKLQVKFFCCFILFLFLYLNTYFLANYNALSRIKPNFFPQYIIDQANN